MAGIKLLACGTPNGKKIGLFLRLLNLDYDLQLISLAKKEQKLPEFLKLNPNGRIPTLVDSNTGITISQSGPVLAYLAENYDKDYKFSYRQGTPEYYKQLEILAFQISENGPIQGQAEHFITFAPEKIPYGITRYTNETKRIYLVFEEYLNRNKDNGPYLVGDHYSIADVALYPWANGLGRLGIDINEWPLLSKWFSEFGKFPGVKEGMDFDKLKV